MSELETNREFQRILFEEYQEYLIEQGFEADVNEGYGTFDLVVSVPCPSDVVAHFAASVNDDIPGRPIILFGNCMLPLADKQISKNWSFSQSESAEDICEDIIIDFIDYCAYTEFSAVVKAEIINDANLENYVEFLSDDALTTEGEYAVGFNIQDEGGMEIAAAASFFITPNELVVDNMVISDNYDIPGFDQYIAEYIYNTVTVDDEE